jgi:hypothetical protein
MSKKEFKVCQNCYKNNTIDNAPIRYRYLLNKDICDTCYPPLRDIFIASREANKKSKSINTTTNYRINNHLKGRSIDCNN